MPRKPKSAPVGEPGARSGKRPPVSETEILAALKALDAILPEAPEPANLPSILPVLPIRDQVYFPDQVFPLIVGREKSVRALDDACSGERYLLLVTQSDVQAELPGKDDLYDVGIIAEIMQPLRMPDGTVRVMLEGIERARVVDYVQTEPHFRARVELLPTLEVNNLEAEALMRSVRSEFEQIVSANKNVIQPEAQLNVINTHEPGKLADLITPYLRQMRLEAQQEILETLNPIERLHKLSLVLKKEAEILDIQRIIRSRVEKEMGDSQREFILREQLKAIQQELGERDERGGEIDEYRTKVRDCGMSEPAAERAQKEVDRLERMPFAAPEGVVVRTYLDWLVSMPWAKSTPDMLDVEESARILDEDHYGLEKAKERIVEFLAIRKLTGTIRGPILCFVGPPGVGKTSIGKSIARALGRRFVRVSLGGVRDEAEIRGHRRTYIGSMPGRILQGIKLAGANNPVFMLDEIDKLGMDFRGDPSSALLEALDPEQNREFSDHYLEVPFDLSHVLFVTTANLLDPIPPALRDRMEVITFPGYTEDEKRAIATQFLIPNQRREHGLQDQQLMITPDALTVLIREYTREAGVRNLQREIAALCRKAARRVASGVAEAGCIAPETLQQVLGARRYHYGVMEEHDEVGAATGLVYTEMGGDVVSIEVSLLKGHEGRVQLTGRLGDVMKESAQTALSFIRSRTAELGVDEEFYRKLDLHVHVPAGSVPKDGPSAGVTIAMAIASALTRRPVRKDVAMTGEITLRGRILPVGGVKEKVLAAHRAGIRTVALPKENEKDLEELPVNVRAEMRFHLLGHIDEMLDLVLLPVALPKPAPSAPAQP